jgi:hypothetical protein
VTYKEARKLEILLTFLLDMPPERGEQPTSEDAMMAASMLADAGFGTKHRRTLVRGCFIQPADVRRRWKTQFPYAHKHEPKE